jgi:hypothetical protein
MSAGVPPATLALHEGLQPRTEAGPRQLQALVGWRVAGMFYSLTRLHDHSPRHLLLRLTENVRPVATCGFNVLPE